ncbi:MAG: riboflavin synthase, partial [Alphaproteobacteria bacterium]
MFTGLVSDIGRIVEMRRDANGAQVSVETSYDVETIEMG